MSPSPARSLLLWSAWPLASALEVLWAAGTLAPPGPAWSAAAVGLAAALGLLQVLASRRWAIVGWPGWPALAWLSWSLAASGLFTWWGGPLVAAAALAAGVLLARIAAREGGGPAPAWAPVLAIVAVVVGRLLVLGGHSVQAPHAQLGRELLRPVQADPPAGQGPPLVLITVDTLRSDHAVRTDTWRRLADRGRRWERAMSTSSWTVPAVASMHTGLPPAEHGAGSRGQGKGFSALPDSATTLAEELSQAGYRTEAVVVNPFISRALGLAQGFSTWRSADEDPAWPLLLLGRPGPAARDGIRVADLGLALLDALPERGWFLWLHLFDPHLPYLHLPEGSLAAQVEHPKQLRKGEIDATPELRRAIAEAYEVEVEYADAQVGRVLDALEARGFFEAGGTLVYTADHGEELWDHGGFEHGHSHHGEVVDVPLLVVGPGIPPDSEGQGVASLLDVAPTLRAAAGLPPRGRDLAQALEPDRIATASGNLYGKDQHSARGLDRRVILDRQGKGEPPTWATRRYELAGDPREVRPLQPMADDPVEAAARLAAAAAANPVQGAAADVNEEALRALGYIE